MAKRFKFLKRRREYAQLETIMASMVLAVVLVVAAIANVVSRFSN
jgi:hypothetical protein